MGLRLHEKEAPERDVNPADVALMRSKMKMDQHYSEETNEILNLMARKIKTRGQERVNLYTLEQKDDSK